MKPLCVMPSNPPQNLRMAHRNPAAPESIPLMLRLYLVKIISALKSHKKPPFLFNTSNTGNVQ